MPQQGGVDASVEAAHAELGRQLADPAGSPVAIAAGLDALDPEARTALVRRLSRREQAMLYRRVEGHRAVRLVDLVPPDRPDLAPVRHLGLNTLPAFRVFEKRFCRSPGEPAASPERLAGYNHQRMAFVTGPGYFVATEEADRGEVVIDYRALPEQIAPGWPAVRSNERGLARFVYGFMLDRLRGVSEHVTVGSAERNGRDLGSYFVLNRID